ncbi:GNAT family N-acetyltransferase [Rhizobium rhizogenes]|uniref:GNAT family N-acetyltransferase n=1 Tax=Rhizobium rhizogenes TaxID=359 RepID=UPI002270AE4B|nr:GNAT family N-acetyltransferase [Rhizobium rhizogenes]
MAGASIAVLDNPSDADRRAILTPLDAFNKTKAGDENYEPIAIVLRDEAEKIVGGLWAQLYFDWVFIELLFIPENLRGENLGARLLSQLEEIAKAKNCVGVWLDTFSFQAPGFYERQGYERFATMDNYPKGMARFFFRKVF